MPTAFDVFVCEECKGVDFGFDTARAPLRYDGVGKGIVQALKYGHYLPVVERLMVPMLRELAQGNFDVVVPVPLHRSRLRSRGFNQAETMAVALANEIKVPVSDRLEAVRRTRDQVQLTAAERRANVEGAFRTRGAVRGRILLIDDVFTTGATLSACATELTRAGAGEVHALSLCRTC
jgi:ComF family protein